MLIFLSSTGIFNIFGPCALKTCRILAAWSASEKEKLLGNKYL